MQSVVFKLSNGSQVGVVTCCTEVCLGGCVDEKPVLSTPAVLLVLFVRAPSSEIFPVKQDDLFSEIFLNSNIQKLARPLRSSPPLHNRTKTVRSTVAMNEHQPSSPDDDGALWAD